MLYLRHYQGAQDIKRPMTYYKAANAVQKIEQIYFLSYVSILEHQYNRIVWLSGILQKIQIMEEMVGKIRRIILITIS